MKTFSVAVVVAVLLAFVYLQESSALPSRELEDLELPVTDDNVAAAYEKIPEDSWKMVYSNRPGCSPAGCRFCCRCCPRMSGCGICCKH